MKTMTILTTDEKCVTSEDSTVIAVFEQKTDAVLGMARCVESFHFDVLANSEGFAVAWGGGDFVAILATDDGQRVALEKLNVSAGMVVVAGYLVSPSVCEEDLGSLLVGVDDVCQLDAAVCCFLQVW